MAEAQELRVQPHDLVAEQSVLGAIPVSYTHLGFINGIDFSDSRT